MEWLTVNAGTIAVGAGLVILVAFIVKWLFFNRNGSACSCCSGCSSCGCGCACSSAEASSKMHVCEQSTAFR